MVASRQLLVRSILGAAHQMDAPPTPSQGETRMKPWPSLPEQGDQYHNLLRSWDYERARYEACLERLRVAHKALGQLAIGLPTGPGEEDGFTYDEAAEVALKALQAIGPLPE
jgi:hypothetical protein